VEWIIFKRREGLEKWGKRQTNISRKPKGGEYFPKARDESDMNNLKAFII
jgi:hypothetical protein